jgi:hypothetical protein
MRRVVSVIEALAVGVALVIPLAVLPAVAQTLKPDPGPEEERMPAMTRTMRGMHRDMEHMRGEMRGEHMRGMRERMGASGCPALAPKER